MPSVNIVVPHTHGQQSAFDKLHGFMAKMKEQYRDQVSDLQESWQGNQLSYSFKTFGMKVSGTVDVRDQDVAVKADLPLAAIMFKGKIEEEIRGTLQKVLT